MIIPALRYRWLTFVLLEPDDLGVDKYSPPRSLPGDSLHMAHRPNI